MQVIRLVLCMLLVHSRLGEQLWICHLCVNISLSPGYHQLGICVGLLVNIGLFLLNIQEKRNAKNKINSNHVYYIAC